MTALSDPPAVDAFEGVQAWVFDLDNTLYPAACRLFDQIDVRMTRFIAEALDAPPEEANRLRKHYWDAHGTTLKGLMVEHGLSPAEFLDYVHDIDLSGLDPAPALRDAVAALPGRKIVHTNGSRGHARRVLARLGALEAFDGLYGIEDSDYDPKPARVAYLKVLAKAEIAPRAAAMFEDTARNLIEPHRLGMRTIWAPGAEPDSAETRAATHVHHVAEDLTAFLEALNPPGR